MRALIQRVNGANVEVGDDSVGSIEKGILVFLGVKEEDLEKDIDYLINKIVNLRIFADEEGKMNLSLLDVKGDLLVVSQFTLYADCSRGRRPDFFKAAKPEFANRMYELFVDKCKKSGIRTETGVFGAMMNV